MKLSFTHADPAERAGTSFQGEYLTTYQDIVNTFGEPTCKGDGEKTTVEWIIKFENGSVATIYDWKYGYTPKDFAEWNIGGKDKQDYYNVLFQLMRAEK